MRILKDNAREAFGVGPLPTFDATNRIRRSQRRIFVKEEGELYGIAVRLGFDGKKDLHKACFPAGRQLYFPRPLSILNGLLTDCP